MLYQRLQNAVSKIKPNIPYDCQQQAIREVLNITSSDLIANNLKFNQMLKSFVAKKELNIYQIQILTKTRDTLLPN